MHDRASLVVSQVEKCRRVPPSDNVDLTSLKLLPVHEHERQTSPSTMPFLLAIGDNFAEEARIIQRQLTAPVPRHRGLVVIGNRGRQLWLTISSL